MYGSREMEKWSATDRLFFLPFYPPKNIKIEQMKKMPGNIISLKCTIKDKHMMYDS